MQEEILTICNIHSFRKREKQLLDHFINHYKNLLKTKIIFCCSEKNEEMINYCDSGGLDCVKFDDFNENTMYGEQDSKRINLIKNKHKKWFVPADLDEFLDLPEDFSSLYELKEFCIKNNAKYVMGGLVDRFVEKDKIKKEIDETPISDQFPYKEKFTRKIMKGWATKIFLCSPEFDVGPGHHFVASKEKNFKSCFNRNNLFFVNHYKWFGDILDLEEKKMNIRKQIKNGSFKEQERLLDYMKNQ